MQKSMGADGLHIKVLRELAEITARTICCL